jgi:hypothetical protein
MLFEGAPGEVSDAGDEQREAGDVEGIYQL